MGKIHLESELFDLNFLTYYLKNAERFIQANTVGMGIPHVSGEVLRTLFIAFPNKDVQIKISKYLDHQTTIIDHLIHQKEKLIDLLKEKRQAVIKEAVTKGLNPEAKRKESNISWIGDIPEHWHVSKLKWTLDFCNSKRVPIEAAERHGRKGPYPYYGASGIIDSVDDYLFDGEYILVGEDGANILSRSTPLAFIAKGKFWVNNHAHILKVLGGEIEYYCEQLELNDYATLASGSAQPKLTKEALANLSIIVPPPSEQYQIVNYLRDVNHTTDLTTYMILEQIDKIKEYRQSIISEAVTGKIDVRDWQPNKQQVA
jgi:type I restriction enzyme S subunit